MVSTIGDASTTLNGLLTSEDKRRLDALYAVLGETTDEDSFVNTINEILAIFNNYPEGVDLVSALNGKLNVSDVVNNLTSEETSKPLSAKQGKVLSDAITTETNRATGVEETLQSSINTLSSDISTETSRATTRENEIETKVTTETNRATGVEEALQSSISTNSSAITTESNRAKGVEEALQSSIGTLSSEITTEEERATTRENEIEAKVTTEEERATTRENEIEAKVTTEKDRAIARENEIEAKVDASTFVCTIKEW